MSSQAAQSMRPDETRQGTPASSDLKSTAHGQDSRDDLKSRAEAAARDAREKASALTANATESAKAEARAAAENAKRLADELAAQASTVADQAVSRVRETVDGAVAEQRDRAAGFVGSIEKAVGAAAKSLDDDGYGTIANYVRYASDTLSSVNEEVGSFQPQRFTGQAERAVRRNPIITYGVLAVAGFALVSLMQQRR